MDPSTSLARWIGRVAWISPWITLLIGQLHALARFATADGRADLEYPLTRLWAVPTAEVVASLLRWADPDVVYLTYGKVWFLASAATTACAFVVHGVRRPQGFEQWAWRVALAGYVAMTLACFLDYWTQWTSYNGFIEIALLISIPAVLVAMIGSALLGFALLRRGFRPRLAPVLLLSQLPALFLIVQVTSLGNVALPLYFAFGILGRRIWVGRSQGWAARPQPVRHPSTVHLG